MPCFSRSLFAGTALGFLSSATLADVTAQDVWTDWKAYVTGFGYTISGTETRTNTGLTISGVRVDFDNGGDTGSMLLDRIVLTEQAGGAVSIDLPAIMPIQASAANDLGGVTRVSMDYRQTGLDIVASGTPEAIQYDYTAQEISLKSTGFEVNGDVLAEGDEEFSVSLENLSGRTDVQLNDMRRYEQSLQADTLRYNLSIGNQEVMTRGDVTGQIQNVTFEGKSVLPVTDIDTNDVDAMLAAGFAVDGTFGFAANAMGMNVDSPRGKEDISLVGGPGTLTVEIGENGLSYDIAQTDLQADVKLSQLPLPLQFAVARSAFELAIPIRQSETPEDFGLGISLEGFEMADALWGLFDPSGQLPRDPATVVLDLTGKAKLLLNFLDPSETALNTPDGAPFEVERVDINRLEMSAVGTELTGTGAFVFDYSQTGAPKPNGAVDLSLSGGNGLIDKLVGIGMLPEQQAMGARMMMGLLAVPGIAPDTMTSKIEINTQGHIMANGQRIQ